MLSKDIFKYLLIALIVGYLFFKIIRPLVRQMFPPPPPPPPPPVEENIDDDEEGEEEEVEEEEPREPTAAELFEQKLEQAREIAKQSPEAIANIIRDWMNPNAGG